MSTHDKKMRERFEKEFDYMTYETVMRSKEELFAFIASEVKRGVEEAEKQIIQATIDLLDIKPTLNSKDTIVLLKSIIIPSTQEHE